MKVYDIEVEEILRRVVPTRSDNIDNAIDIVSDKIYKEEIVLDSADFKERNIHNLHSKKLDKSLEININYDLNTELLTIKYKDIICQYSAEEVSNIKSCLSLFVDEYIEEPEIVSSKNEQNDKFIELLEDNEIYLDERN